MTLTTNITTTVKNRRKKKPLEVCGDDGKQGNGAEAGTTAEIDSRNVSVAVEETKRPKRLDSARRSVADAFADASFLQAAKAATTTV